MTFCTTHCRVWTTWGNVCDPLSAHCPISAMKLGTISCRNRRLRPDVGPLASNDYLQSYFSLQSTFKMYKFSGLTRNSFLTLEETKTNSFLIFLYFLSLNFSLVPARMSQPQVSSIADRTYHLFGSFLRQEVKTFSHDSLQLYLISVILFLGIKNKTKRTTYLKSG